MNRRYVPGTYDFVDTLMDDPVATPGSERDRTQEAVRAFYDLHPYPPPIEDLESYRRRWPACWPNRPTSKARTVWLMRCSTPAASQRTLRQQARSLFQRLWWCDQIVFDASHEDDDTPDLPRIMRI